MLCSCYIFSIAQSNQAAAPGYEFWNPAMQAIAKPNSKPGWIYFKDDFSTPPEQIFTLHKEAFGLGLDDSMHLFKQKTDDLGWTHYWFQQYYKGYEVIGSQVSLHINDYSFLTGKVSYIENIDLSLFSVDSNFLLNTSNFLSFINSDLHSYDNEYCVVKHNNSFLLCKKVFFVSEGFSNSLAFVNNSNDIIKVLNLSPNCTHHSSCTTYNGEQNYNVDYSNPIIELKDECGNAKIYTGIFTPSNGISPGSFSIIAENESVFSCSYNCNQNNYTTTGIAGTCPNTISSLHWGLTKLLEFLNNYSIECIIDDCNHRQGFVSGNFQNASFSVLDQLAYFGKYDINSPLVSLDVIGHEWGHGLAFNETVGPGLIYDNGPSGIVHESFADILGVMLEFYAEGLYDNDKNGDWLYGEDYMQNVTGSWARNLSNPKDVPFDPNFPNIFPQPNTYGEFIESEYYDGLPHNGSGVMNHWFYLLSEGGSGQNDHNFCYEVNPLSKLVAFEILMRAFLNYFNNSTAIYDVRLYTIQAAEDLYGSNSFEWLQVKNAWDAVGVYEDYFEATGIYVNANNENVYFNYDLNANLVIPAQSTIYINGDFTIKQNITFDITSGLCTVYVASNSNIVIEGGAKLKANRATFYFGDNSSIIVKTNGNIDFGTSGIYLGKGNYCDDTDNSFWKGIVVEDLQGGAILMEGTTIENAEIALDFRDQTITPYFSIKKSQFINNKQSLVLLNPTIIPFDSLSNIVDTKFEINDTFPLAGNLIPIFTLAGKPQINLRGLTYNSLIINECTFIKSSIFSQDAIQCKGDIILSSTYFKGFENQLILFPLEKSKIVDNEFVSFQTASQIIAGNRNIINVAIEENKFSNGILGLRIQGTPNMYVDVSNKNIFTSTKKGIYALNTEKLTIEDNEFFIPPASSETIGFRNQDNYGIFLAGSKDYLVKTNEFYLSGVANLNTYLQNIRSYGVITDNSGFTGKSSIFNNIFNETNFGYTPSIYLPTSFAFHSQGINDKVNVRCNNFNINNGRMRGMNIVSGTLAKQGVSCDNNTLQAGNEWSNLCEPGPFGAAPDNADIYISNTAQPFEYWAHAQNESGLETTIPKCNFLPSGFLKVCDGDDPVFPIPMIKNSQSCNEPYIGLKSLKVLKDSLSQHELLFVKIPEQQTAKNNLITQLSAKQNQLNDPVQQKELVNEISYLNNEILIVNKNLSRLFEAAEMPEEAKQVLQEDNDIATKMELLQTLLKKGEIDEAEALLNSLIGQYQASYFFDSWEIENKYIDNINYEREVADIEKDMLKQERDTLLPSEKIILDGIKASDLPVASKAEVLLIQSGTDWDEHPIIKIEEELLLDSLELDTFNYALLATPNPSLGQTEISFNLPNGVNEYTLEVIDTYQNIGQVKYSHTGQYEETAIQINTSNWSIGTYSVVLNIQGEVVSNLHLLVIY